MSERPDDIEARVAKLGSLVGDALRALHQTCDKHLDAEMLAKLRECTGVTLPREEIVAKATKAMAAELVACIVDELYGILPDENPVELIAELAGIALQRRGVGTVVEVQTHAEPAPRPKPECKHRWGQPDSVGAQWCLECGIGR